MQCDQYVLEFELSALHKIFLVADIMDEHHGVPLEYAFIGLVDRPFRVVECLLLPNQSVGQTHVELSGRNVLRLRDEIAAYSRLLSRNLSPLVFIHRHPYSATAASVTDIEFLEEVFIRQIASAHTFMDDKSATSVKLNCACASNANPTEYAICFSLIVSRNRGYHLYALRKDACPMCGIESLRYVPATLKTEPATLPAEASPELRASLQREIDQKIQIEECWSDSHERK